MILTPAGARLGLQMISEGVASHCLVATLTVSRGDILRLRPGLQDRPLMASSPSLGSAARIGMKQRKVLTNTEVGAHATSRC